MRFCEPWDRLLGLIGEVGSRIGYAGERAVISSVTAMDNHSRFCMIAKVVERATARTVSLALAEALARFGVPEEIITDIQAATDLTSTDNDGSAADGAAAADALRVVC